MFNQDALLFALIVMCIILCIAWLVVSSEKYGLEKENKKLKEENKELKKGAQ